LLQPGTDYEISKPLCDAAAHFDFREWTPNDLLYDLRRTEFGTLEASIRLYCLGEKLSKPEANYNFWTENFTPNRLFITKSLAFFYKMVKIKNHNLMSNYYLKIICSRMICRCIGGSIMKNNSQ